MMAIEERLREALAETAELVHWPADAAEPERPMTRRFPKWSAPLAAAATIALVIAAGLVTATTMRNDDAATPTADLPRHFVTLLGENDVRVRDVTNGKVTGRVAIPYGVSVTGIAATSDDHLFYVSGMTYAPLPFSKDRAVRRPETWLYRLRINDAGRTVSLTRVARFPTSTGQPHPASTLDGKSLAVQGAGNGDLVRLSQRKQSSQPLPRRPSRKSLYGPMQIDVVTLATGRREVFKSTATGAVGNISWAADGRRLLYTVVGSKGRDGIWLLDTRAGHDLLKASRRVSATAMVYDGLVAGALGGVLNPVLSPDGSKIYLVAAQPDRRGGPTWTRLIEVDAATGRQLRVLFEQRYKGTPPNAYFMFTTFALEPGGRGLLVISNGHGYRIDLATERISRFQFPEGDANTVAW